MTFTQKLTSLIERHATTQALVEKAVGLPQGRISKWIAGQGSPTLGQGLRLARWFGVSLVWLADEELGELPVEEASGDLRTILAVVGVLGSQEALRRLLLLLPDDPHHAVSLLTPPEDP